MNKSAVNPFLSLNKKNVLITGARAPIALDWAHRLKQHTDCRVVMADSLSYPISIFSDFVDKYYKVSPPRFTPKKYVEDIVKIIKSENVELLIPTCEEIFYLARFKHLIPTSCECFFDEFNKLSSLHNKFAFIDMVTSLEKTTGLIQALPETIQAPETLYIESKEALLAWEKSHTQSQFILKPVYSRFGSEVIFDIENNKKEIRYPVVVQEKLKGIELCSYSVVVKGKVMAHSCYYPKYKAGPGAGVYIEPKQNKAILEFVQALVEKINFTGQIAFDFFEDKNTIYPIECNPRGTSGLHILPDDLFSRLERGVERDTASLLKPTNLTPVKVNFGMWLFVFKHIKDFGFKQFVKDYKKSIDVYSLCESSSITYKQLISFGEILYKSLFVGMDIKRATTQDIEWDGHVIKDC